MANFNVIVVGAGSAGSVLATRLTEDRSRDVLLLEAGHHYLTADEFPEELQQASSLAATVPGHPNSWAFVGELMPGKTYPMPRGKVVGGSSAVNATYFIRGRRQDFDQWVDLGNDQWSFDRVLPYFIKSETDLDFQGEFHGASGPIPVRRPEQMRPVSEAFYQACLDAGYPEESDKNSDGVGGIGPVPHNRINGIRMNTAITYLNSCLDRPNLTVMGDTFVQRVLFDGTRAIGVEAVQNGESVQFYADEVVLSAGGIKSPHLLMLSGVGPADLLREHGIGVVCDSPGVGQNVMDHPSVRVVYRIPDDNGPTPADFKISEACLNFTSPGSTIDGDLQLMCSPHSLNTMLRRSASETSRFSKLPDYLRRPIATINGLRKLQTRFLIDQARSGNDLALLCGLDQERSTGEIKLTSADPSIPPSIELGYLSDTGDLGRIRASVRVAAELLTSPEFQKLDVTQTSLSNDELSSDAALDAWITRNLTSSMHTACGARMGPQSDATSVVSQECRVHGVEAIRVVDISIMPRIVRRGPSATAVMIGERAAAFFD